MDGNVDVFEGGGSRDWRADGEAEAVGLVDVVVGILADDYGFNGVEGSVAGPLNEELVGLIHVGIGG